MDDEQALDAAEPLDAPPPESWLKHLFAFLCSVIPADPWQLIYLAGLVLVLVLGAVPMVPQNIESGPGGYESGGGSFDVSAFVPYVIATVWVSLAASCAGFFTCFWPGRRPALRILAFVVLPSVAVIALLVWRIYQLSEPVLTIFEHRNIGSLFHWLGANVWRLPSGLYIAACGVVMILIYAIRLASSKSTFPISVSPSGLATEEDRKYWIRVQWFLFIYFGAYIAIEAIVFVPFSLLELALFSRFHSSVVFSASKGVARILDAAIFLGISLYILGRQGKDTAVKLLRLPEPRHAMIGVFIPTFISALVPAGEWAVARIHWAQHNIGLTQPPEFASYLDLVNAWQPWLLLMVLGAFAEEVVFRGVLLSFFIKRYGLHRGIFFTGIAWAMIHFRADRYSGLNFAEVLLQLVFRIAFCVALNFVLAWMTLRWKSIIPAGLAHTVWNIIVTSGIVVGFEWRWGVDIFSWAVVAVVLWRYWPIENPTESTSIPTDAPEVPA